MGKVALLIGVSEYKSELAPLPAAVKDVQAMYRVLHHPGIGHFDEVQPLLNPDTQTMQRDIGAFFRDRRPEDLVVLYFSGHGIKDDDGQLYFATRLTESHLINATAVPAHFIHRAMNNCRARRQVIILDCCFSGAFDPRWVAKSQRHKAARVEDAIDFQNQLGAEGRVVLTSSSSTEYSFEDMQEDLSLYTRYLVQGLETGQADRSNNGEILVQELHDYACQNVQAAQPDMKPRIIVLKDEAYNIVIARLQPDLLPPPLESPPDVATQVQAIALRLGTMPTAEFDPMSTVTGLSNFLECYEPLIAHLVHQIETHARTRSEAMSLNARLSLMQDATQADALFVWQQQAKGEWRIVAHSDRLQFSDIEALRSQIVSTIHYDQIFSPSAHGIYRIWQDQLFIFVPLQTVPQPEFLLVCHPYENNPVWLGDPYGLILSTVYRLSSKAIAHPALAEAALIDALKDAFGFVSPVLYQRRFTLFCNRLRQMTVYFQPIVRLEPLRLMAWEALARDPEDASTPTDLFHAAELWGTQFMLELDLYFLTLATNRYLELRTEQQLQRFDDTHPLSVNVYPDSLIRTAYFEQVRQIIQTGIIPPDKLILEISERSELPKHPHWNNQGPEWSGFKQKLKEYALQGLGVKFAIDDFGVGYASVSRLVGLKLDYVKIDREILYHAPEVRDKVISFVREVLIEAGYYAPHVIVEGVDENCPISLHALKEIGVRYIQGYVVDQAMETIYGRLSSEKYQALHQRLQVPA